MKNWVILENKEIVYKVGEFFIQVTTIENILEQIFNEFETCMKCRDIFADGTFGKKIKLLSEQIKIKGSNGVNPSIEERLSGLNNFRNKIAHSVFNYNPNDKKVYVRGEIIDDEMDKHISGAGELLIDMHIVLSSVKDSRGYKDSITKKEKRCKC